MSERFARVELLKTRAPRQARRTIRLDAAVSRTLLACHERALCVSRITENESPSTGSGHHSTRCSGKPLPCWPAMSERFARVELLKTRAPRQARGTIRLDAAVSRTLLACHERALCASRITENESPSTGSAHHTTRCSGKPHLVGLP